NEVPDPVFAQKMVGDGVSLDPTSDEVLAPVAGTVTQLHEAKHALTITTESGVEVLVHVGVDTVALRGEGFRTLVGRGSWVEAGQPLLAFDLDRVARRARSLLTQIVVANGDRVRELRAASGRVRAGKDAVLVIDLAGGGARKEPRPGVPPRDAEVILSERIVLPNPAGLHARPSAMLAACARRYEADVRLLRGADEANAKSVVALMALSTRYGETVQVKACGIDAAQAAETLAEFLTAGCGEKPGDAPAGAFIGRESRQEARSERVATLDVLAGEPASPGLAVGRIFQYRRIPYEIAREGGDRREEHRRFSWALEEAGGQLERFATGGPGAGGSIAAAQRELLQDPELQETTLAGIEAGQSAAYAWRAAFETHAEKLEVLVNGLLRERAADVRDVGQRVLSLLLEQAPGRPDVPENAILIAEELTPSDTLALDRTKVAGFCTTKGGVTGHVAILARSLGLPALCGIDQAALELGVGTLAILDTDAGVLRHRPTEAELSAASAVLAREAARRAAETAAASAPAITTDGQRIEVAANVRNADEIREANALGGEGVGLLRSEFLFEGRASAPAESEQAAAYVAAAEALGPGRPLVIRTLDIGGDKPLPYLPLPAEENPFLGLRGVRVSLEHPELFRAQLRAILQTPTSCDLHVMFPMVAGLDEFRAAKAVLREELRGADRAVKVGVMIEIPSAALLAGTLAREADFFSIGTNDLTQYTLAMDRGHAKLARRADALHPAVLRMIALTLEGAHRHGRWVGVCGAMASDAQAVPVLVGLGVDELSVPPVAIPAIKAQIRRLSVADCRRVATEVLEMGTASEVRACLEAFAQPPKRAMADDLF
ncbi:MAG TPA: phosphoenolpyruvate--protein phosphotransferase, partial [Opitutaceae bacterium]